MIPPGRSLEMTNIKTREDSVAHGSSYTMREPVYDDEPSVGATSRIFDSFRRDPSRRVTPLDPKDEAAIRAEAGRAEHDGLRYYDIHQATLQTAHSGLARKLKGRHLQMIAIGGSIGEFSLLSVTRMKWALPLRDLFPFRFRSAPTNLRVAFSNLLKPYSTVALAAYGIRVAPPPRRAQRCTLSNAPPSKAPVCSWRPASP